MVSGDFLLGFYKNSYQVSVGVEEFLVRFELSPLEKFDIEYVEIWVVIDDPTKVSFLDALEIGKQQCEL